MRFFAGAAIALALAGCTTNDPPLAFGPAPDDDVGPTDVNVELRGPTYYGAVDDILAEHCWRCHSPASGLGIATDFTDASDTTNDADTIVLRTQGHTMPAFFAVDDGTCRHFDDQGRTPLDDFELDILSRWASRGAQVGQLDETMLPMQPVLPTLSGMPSASIMSAVAFSPARTETRCFVLPVTTSTTTDTFITAFEVTPGNAPAVHNVVVYEPDSEADETTALALQAQNASSERPARPGYPCGGAGEGVAAHPVAVWTPGSGAITYPVGTGLSLPAGRQLILQVHYDVGHAAPPTRSNFQLDGGGIGDGGHLSITAYAPDQTRVDFVTGAVPHPAQMVRVGPASLSLAPGQPSVSATGTQSLTAAGTVWSVFPLMHTHGTALDLSLMHAGANSCMLRMTHWDLAWQQAYDYTDAAGARSGIDVANGDSITVTCTYSTAAERDTITAGDHPTTSEACVAYAYVSQP